MALERKINLPLIFRTEGFLLLIEGLFMLLVVPVTYLYHGVNAYSIPFSALITLMTGFILVFATRGRKGETIRPRDGMIIVSLSWVVLSVFGGMPYLMGNYVPNFTDAFFEALSGFTTTGASIIPDVESLPKDILFWRCMTQWIGGIAIVVFTVAILPFLGMSGMQLFVSEMNGITYDKLHPRIMHTAKRIWAIYLILTILEVVLLNLGDMDLYDSICHSMSTISTGGFSTRNLNMAAFSNYSQVVVTVFMVLAACNFCLLLLSVTWKSFNILRNHEFQILVQYVLVIGISIALTLIFIEKKSAGSSFRMAFFSVVSSLTTTGFYVTDYLRWPVYLWVTLLLLMFIGGCSGSTSGGVKIIRHLMFLKNALLELKRIVHPNAVMPVNINRKSVSSNVVYKNLTFIFVFVMIFVIGALALYGMGIDFDTAIGASSAAICNTGMGIGRVGPFGSYAFLPQIAKWLLSLFMLLGRVELFPLIIIFTRNFWR